MRTKGKFPNWVAPTLAAVCVLALVAVGFIIRSGVKGGAPAPASAGGVVSDPGGMTPGQAVAATVAGIGSKRILKVTAEPEGTKFAVKVDVASASGVSDSSSLYDGWLADVTTGAVAEELRRTGDASMSDVLAHATLVGSNGVSEDLGVSSVPLAQSFVSPADSVLADRVSASAKAFGLRVSQVSVFHPLSTALAITLVAPDATYSPPPGETLDSLIARIVGDPTCVEGVYIAIDSPAGQHLVEAARASRFGSGRVNFASGQDSVWGVNHG